MIENNYIRGFDINSLVDTLEKSETLDQPESIIVTDEQPVKDVTKDDTLFLHILHA